MKWFIGVVAFIVLGTAGSLLADYERPTNHVPSLGTNSYPVEVTPTVSASYNCPTLKAFQAQLMNDVARSITRTGSAGIYKDQMIELDRLVAENCP